MSTQPSLDARTNRDIKAWREVVKRLDLTADDWRAENKDRNETKPVQGCQSCTCVWPICSWPADSRTCWWCCARLRLGKRKTFPWRAAGRKHVDDLLAQTAQTQFCLSAIWRVERRHGQHLESALTEVIEGADVSLTSSPDTQKVWLKKNFWTYKILTEMCNIYIYVYFWFCLV